MFFFLENFAYVINEKSLKKTEVTAVSVSFNES